MVARGRPSFDSLMRRWPYEVGRMANRRDVTISGIATLSCVDNLPGTACKNAFGSTWPLGLPETSNSALYSTNARAQRERGSMQRKHRNCSDRMAIQPMSSRFCIFLAFATLPLSAQWLNHIPAGTPMKAGRPNLFAPAPRATNGKPDLTGVWMHETFSLEQMKKFYGPAADEEANIGMEIFTVHKYGLNALLDAKPGEQVMTAAGQAAFKQRQQSRNVKDVCHNRYGWPVLSLLSEPFKIVQAPKETMIVYEIDNQHRQVFTDGRKFPAEFEFPARLGYSIGRWEGDTFVVETRGFNDDTPIDGMGHPRSEDMHVTERYHRRDFGHLETEITWDDPKYYIRPITVKINYNLVPDNDIFEMYCNENEKDLGHMVAPK
jgi:hypothetical protein